MPGCSNAIFVLLISFSRFAILENTEALYYSSPILNNPITSAVLVLIPSICLLLLCKVCKGLPRGQDSVKLLTIFLSHELVTTVDSQTLLSSRPNIYSTSVHPLSPSLHHSCYLHSLILPPLPLYSLPSSPLSLYLHHQLICACLVLC